MKARIARQALVVSAALALAATSHAEGQQEECAVAVTETPQMVMLEYGCHTVGAAIETTVDVDTFSFTAAAGDRVRIIVDQTSNNCMDPFIDVFGPMGFHETNGCSPSCFPTNTCSFVHEIDIAASGVYVIAVSDGGSNEPGAYTLQLELITPSRPAPGSSYNTTNLFELSPTTDVDAYSFYGQAGSLVRIAVDQTSANCMDPTLEVLDPSGVTILTAACSPSCFPTNTCSFTRDIMLADTGRYMLILSDGGADEPGTGNLSITCILGCPPLTSITPRNAVPNPACYRDVLSPAVGGTWCAEVDATTNPGATVTAVLVCAQPFATPVPTPYGALLVNTATEVRCSLLALAPGQVVGRHSARIPDNVALVGRSFYTQGLSAGPGPRGVARIELCNALDYVMGY